MQNHVEDKDEQSLQKAVSFLNLGMQFTDFNDDNALCQFTAQKR